MSASDNISIVSNSNLDAFNPRRWAVEEDEKLKKAVELYGESSWVTISEYVETRDNTQCRQRWQQALKPGLSKGKWTREEDSILRNAVTEFNTNWTLLAAKLPGRSPKQCRERWYHRISPCLNKAKFTKEEDARILELHEKLGNKWARIAFELNSNRTENMIRSRYNALMKKHQRQSSPTITVKDHPERESHGLMLLHEAATSDSDDKSVFSDKVIVKTEDDSRSESKIETLLSCAENPKYFQPPEADEEETEKYWNTNNNDKDIPKKKEKKQTTYPSFTPKEEEYENFGKYPQQQQYPPYTMDPYFMNFAKSMQYPKYPQQMPMNFGNIPPYYPQFPFPNAMSMQNFNMFLRDESSRRQSQPMYGPSYVPEEADNEQSSYLYHFDPRNMNYPSKR